MSPPGPAPRFVPRYGLPCAVMMVAGFVFPTDLHSFVNKAFPPYALLKQLLSEVLPLELDSL